MELLVVGAAGLLGSNVVAAARDRGHDVVGTYHSTEPPFGVPLSRLDVRDTAAFDDILAGADADAVVNCAAMTDVDGCETDPEAAEVINGTVPGELAAVCAEHEVRFVHVSTDYVFDGTTSAPYTEADEPRPVQAYGRSKLTGERTVRANHPHPLVTRLSFIYGIDQSTSELTGFPAWVRDRLRDGEETPLFVDQHVTPTRAGQAAATILDAVEQDLAGLFHVASRSCVTPYEFGSLIQRRVGAPDALLEKGSQAALDRPATRPEYTCLDVSKVEETLGRSQPTLEEGLDAIAHAF